MQRIDEQAISYRATGAIRTRPAPLPSAPCVDRMAGAWRRWFARTFDVWWQTALVALVLGALFCHVWPPLRHWLETPAGWKIFGLACIPGGLLLDALTQTVAGNTPGKAMLGLKLRTADGRDPGLGELARRNMGLWRAGLCLGLPALCLFTMARQALRLHKGEPASYDGHYFVISSSPVGAFRKGVFGLVFLALAALIMSFDAADRQDSRELAALLTAPPFSWTNPATGRTVSIAAHWRYEALFDDDGGVQHRFTQHSGHAQVLLALEARADSSLRHHARAYAGGLVGQFDLPGGHFNTFRGRPSWVASGERKDGAGRVHLRIVQVEGKTWRVQVLQSPPEAYTGDLVQELSATLWDTVAPP
jgi:hypothetical protein